MGFKFGRAEHKTRAWGYKVLLLGAVVLGCGLYFKIAGLSLMAGAIILLAIILESVSYVAHKLEKKTMDKIRFGKGR